jgi:lysophospholipase L1-like esterase
VGCFSAHRAEAQDRPPPKPRTAESAVTPVCHDLKRFNAIMALKQQGPFDLIFLGASITQFWPTRGPDSWAKFAPYHPANFGDAGACTENTIWSIENGVLDGLHPKVVVLNIGNNNIGQHPTELPAWAAAGIRQVVDLVHQKLPDTKILLLDIFPRNGKNSSDRLRNDAVNRIIAGFANGDTPRYLDIGNAFLDPRGELVKGMMYPDGLHPTALGYQAWYNAMIPTLREMMQSSRAARGNPPSGT